MCSLVFFLYPAFFPEFTHGGGKTTQPSPSACRKMTNYSARWWGEASLFLCFRIIAYNSVSIIINSAQFLPVSPGKQVFPLKHPPPGDRGVRHLVGYTFYFFLLSCFFMNLRSLCGQEQQDVAEKRSGQAAVFIFRLPKADKPRGLGLDTKAKSSFGARLCSRGSAPKPSALTTACVSPYMAMSQ